MATQKRTAVLCIIGNEVLNGRIRDANAWFLTRRLADLGIPVRHIAVIPDEIDTIVDFIRAWSPRCDYLFTTGGIGPTHDDVTREAVAAAVARPLTMHPEAERIVRAYYGDRLNDTRLAMARLPEGAELILNPDTGVPGCIVDNIFVLPGIPSLIERMFDSILPRLEASPVFRDEMHTLLYESEYAVWLGEMARAFPDVSIGSYPILGDPLVRTIVTVASADTERGAAAARKIRERLAALESEKGRR